MTVIKIWILFNMLLFSVALARGQEQQAPRVRALMERVNTEVSNNLQCSEALHSLMDRVRELEKKLKEATKTEDK